MIKNEAYNVDTAFFAQIVGTDFAKYIVLQPRNHKAIYFGFPKSSIFIDTNLKCVVIIFIEKGV